MKLNVKIAIGVLAIVSFGGLMVLRKEANGFRNIFSLTYWRERGAGRDLYVPAKSMLKMGPRNQKAVLLTIDDGPHESILQMLKAMKDEDVKATFFVVGQRVKENPQLVKKMIEDGHEVANHSMNHIRLDTLKPEQVKNEIKDCGDEVEKACGRRMTLFRAPGTRMTDDIIAEIRRQGYTIVHWTVGAQDYVPAATNGHMTPEMVKLINTTPDEVTERVLKQVKNGAIILLHDNPVTAKAMPAIIKGIKERGFRFVSTSEMLASLPTPIELVANPMVERPRVAAR